MSETLSRNDYNLNAAQYEVEGEADPFIRFLDYMFVREKVSHVLVG